jgi:LPS O-antigen subunit length determinant protein (WzzB/FepE family)
MEEKEPELIDYLRIIWKRKYVIGIGTAAFICIAALVSFLAKPVYEIDALIQPGNFLAENQAGNFDRVVVEPPEQIADKVRHKSYNALIAAQLGKKERILPDIKAENIKNTLLARFWVRTSDIRLGKEVLDKLIDLVRADIDKKVKIEIKNLESSIKTNEILKQRSLEEIDILNKKLKIGAQREKDIQKEMESVKGKIAELEKEQLRVLGKENRSEIEALAMLLYSNEVQQSLQYYELLDEKLNKEKLEDENITSAIKEETSKIDQYDNTIKNLEERKGRIDPTKVIKNPTPGDKPVFPRMGLNVLVALIAGLMIFAFVAFLSEYIEKSKPKGT